MWLNDEHLSPVVKTRLLQLMPRNITECMRIAFMREVSICVQLFDAMAKTDPLAQKKEQLKLVADKARDLLLVMGESTLKKDARGLVDAVSKEFFNH